MNQRVINNYDVIVTNKFLSIKLNLSNLKKLVVIEDPRSAAFYCLGINQKKNKKALLFVDDKDLLSCYTALAESFLQKVKLSIIVIGKGEIPDLFKRYSTICDNFHSFNSLHMNAILPYEDSLARNVVISDIRLEELVEKNKSIEFKITDLLNIASDNCRTLDSKIGFIARYIGGVQVKPSVLVCTYKELFCEINTLNLRYINQNFKAIILNQKKICSIDSWLKDNGISIFYEINNFKNFLMEVNPAVLMLV